MCFSLPYENRLNQSQRENKHIRLSENLLLPSFQIIRLIRFSEAFLPNHSCLKEEAEFTHTSAG
ncbi:MAG: hypothetical protein A2026_22170 [Deltaproteobacteria bacterium RBG_19FT_COMBO_46_12]|nr:MAG: hypothetical protein A2026_22170 [Deltaproteobacteria bacterium RBG_19FT_COMBO_46_12]